jgi:ribosomal protein L18
MGIRKNMEGTSARPRLSVFRSNKAIYAQIIDDSRLLLHLPPILKKPN